MASKVFMWDAPDGFWYTQRSVADESQRSFVKHVRSKNALAINEFVLWIDEQKEEWEALWLQDEPLF